MEFRLLNEPKDKTNNGVGLVKLEYNFPVGCRNHHVVTTATIHDVYLFREKLTYSHRKAIKKDTKEIVSVYVFELDTIFGPDREQIQFIIEELRRTDHTNIIKLKEVYEDKSNVYLVMEYVEGNLLFDKQSNCIYSEENAANIIRQILDALIYLNGLGIICHFTPDNFILTKNNQIKILLFNMKSSHEFISPEQIKGEMMNSSSTIYSIGVITYILLCGYTPFYGHCDQEVYRKMLNVQYDYPFDDWNHISIEAKEFIDSILVYDPTKRLTALQASESSWITKPWPKKSV